MHKYFLATAVFVAALHGAALAQLVPGGDPGPQPAPPPAGESQAELDQRFTAYQTGRWKITYAVQGMQITNDFTYRADGSFAGTQTVQQYGTPVTTSIRGTWQVTGIDDKSFTLALYSPSGNGQERLMVIDQNTALATSLQQRTYRQP